MLNYDGTLENLQMFSPPSGDTKSNFNLGEYG